MKVIVRGKNKFVPSEAIKTYADNKVQKLNQYFKEDNELTATFLCKVYDTHHTVEVTIPTKHLILRAEVKDESVYSAIDLAIDKLESQIRKHKSKLYKSIQKRDGVANHYAQNTDFDAKAIESEILATNLVKNKSVDLKPMSKEEAILQMEMLDHNFFVFQDSETMKIAVVYLRDDGDYGIIETNSCPV